MVKTFLLVCIMGLSVGLLAACQQTSDTPQAIRFAVAQAPLNLDPRYATDAASERVNRLLYQRLVEFDANSRPIPSLASWQAVTPRHYRLVLKNEIAPFHHQKPFSAHDVKATYDSLLRLADSAHSAEYANIREVAVIDMHTVDFKLQSPDMHFAEKLIIGILPKDLIEKKHDFVHKPVGNGALQFERWEGKLVLKRVKDAQIITFTEVKDPTVRVLKLLRGETDLLQGDLPPELIKYLQAKPEVQVKTTLGTNFSYLGLNMQDPVLQPLKVRQAIAHAIDRQAVIDTVMVSDTRLANVILPPEHYAGNATLPAYTYNPTLAKELLQAAGVELPLKLVYKTSTDAQRVRLATVLQAQMAAAGIVLEIRSLDWGTFFEEVKQGNFQMYGLTWVGIKTPDIYTKVFGSAFIPPNGFNRGRYGDGELDQLLANENWPTATTRIHAQLPYIPLWYEGQFAATRRGVKGYVPQADGNWDALSTVTMDAVTR